MPNDQPTDWAGSTWIGAVDLGQVGPDGLTLEDGESYSRARLVVREGRRLLGFVELTVHDGAVNGEQLMAAVAELPDQAPMPAVELPAMSIVLCTRDRPLPLRAAITSILQMDYPDFEVVIVDNASRTNASQEVVADFDDPRVRLITEPHPGLARARNTGVKEAVNEFVAFTDDDVLVDRDWLRGLADGFAIAPDVACVCGIVPSGELRSFSQAYFDRRVTWARSCVPKTYRLAEPPAGEYLFPFQVGQYGTGANFGMRRSTIFELGGFDEALGVGSPTRGGEDIDMFVRTLLGGHALGYQPTALVWHRHRADMESLHEQITGYGLGLGAWIGKLLSNRRTASMVLRRAGRGLLHARKMTKVDLSASESGGSGASERGLAATELRAVARGPLAYWKARRAGARSCPLKAQVDARSAVTVASAPATTGP